MRVYRRSDASGARRWGWARHALVSVLLAAGLTVGVVAPAQAATSASEVATAVHWAENMMVTNPGADYDECLKFVSDAYASAGVSIGSASTAVAYWNQHASFQHPGDLNPPRGALVFWGPNAASSAGHVGLALGNGWLISTYERSNPDIHEFTIADRNNAGYASSYLGWLMPPGVTASLGGWLTAFQANTNALVNIGQYGFGNTNTGQGMMPGTSPSIALLPNGGEEEAFQANTGALIVIGDGGSINTGQGMMAGTSPSIAASPSGGWRVVFQASNGLLYSYDSASGPANLGQGMMGGTSPNIAALSTGGYETAFQANTGALIVIGDGGNQNTGQGMMSTTSPAIIGVIGGGWRAAFQANTGALIVIGNGGADNQNTGQGMYGGTSPAIAGTLS